MKFFKGQQKKPANKVRNFYILKYLGIAALLLCLPILPAEIPEFHTFFHSKYWLLADIFVLLGIGTLFERGLSNAFIQDAQDRKNGKPALNASSILFFSNPLLFLLDGLAIAHLYALWYVWPNHVMPGTDARLQSAALMVGLFFCIYGKFLPVIPYKNKWGICTSKTTASEEAWKTQHKKAAKRLLFGGLILLIPCLFLQGITALIIAMIGALILLGCCYL